MQGLRLAFAVLAAAVAVSTASVEWAARKLEPSIYWIERLNLADEIRRLPNAARIGAFWPGCFAAVSGRDIAPLDGIVGSNDYFQRYLKSGKVFDYIRERRIQYIAVYLPDSPDAILGRRRPPRLGYWSDLGVRRLWENRDPPISIAAKRTVNGGEVGWYLMRLGG